MWCYNDTVFGDKARVVLDTNVVFEGLTFKKGACGYIIDAWYAQIIEVFVSNALTYEYVDVLARKLSPVRWENTKPILANLLHKANFVTIYYSWRPSSPDPGDDFLVDCVMNANALLVTSNQKDFRMAQAELGILVLTPMQFVQLLAKSK